MDKAPYVDLRGLGRNGPQYFVRIRFYGGLTSLPNFIFFSFVGKYPTSFFFFFGKYPTSFYGN